MRRFLRVPTTLIRCFPLDEHQALAPEAAVERMLSSKDGSLLSWRAKFEMFVDFLTDHCSATERVDYLEATAGTRTGGIRVDADLVEDGGGIVGVGASSPSCIHAGVTRSARSTRHPST